MPASLERQKLQAEIDSLKAKTWLTNEQATLAESTNAQSAASPWNNRVYSFWRPVTRDTVLQCVDLIGTWVNESPDDIHIIFNTPGGQVTHGLALYDYMQEIRSMGVKVITSTVGMAASMGGVLLQAGDERYMGANAFLLIHEVSSSSGGKVSEQEEELAFIKRLQDKCVNILAERSTLDAAAIKRRWKKTDWWLTADEALALGFVDAIR